MGLSPSTLSLVCLLCATFRAPRTCTTILLPSLEGPGGAFDAPKTKCPPDRGSADCVTGSLASSSPYQYSDFSQLPSLHSSHRSIDSISSKSSSQPSISRFASSPRNIPSRNNSTSSTPPLTPDDSSDCSGLSGSSFMDPDCKNDALDFLMSVFPHQGLSALPHAKSVSISAPNLGADFEGVVLELPGTPKTLYVDGKSAASVSLRESIVALLDLADESLGCHALIIVLERSSPTLSGVLHSLMYVGGAVVTKPPFKVDPAYVLVGLEI